MRYNKKREIINTSLKRAVDVMGGQSALAKAIGVAQQNIWSWLFQTGITPAQHVLDIEKATKQKGDCVTRSELRPDIYPKSEAA